MADSSNTRFSPTAKLLLWPSPRSISMRRYPERARENLVLVRIVLCALRWRRVTRIVRVEKKHARRSDTWARVELREQYSYPAFSPRAAVGALLEEAIHELEISSVFHTYCADLAAPALTARTGTTSAGAWQRAPP